MRRARLVGVVASFSLIAGLAVNASAASAAPLAETVSSAATPTVPTTRSGPVKSAHPARPSAPSAPSTVSGKSGNGQASVSWSVPSDDGGSAVTGYTVTASPGGQTATTTGATTAVVKGLTNGKPYTFTVTAKNAIGASAPSAPSPAVMPLSPEVTYGHDDLGRMTAVFDSTGAGSKISYDEVGNITGIASLPAGAVAVAQISPERAPVGASVDVYGVGFGTDPSAITVSFNGATVSPTAANLHRNRLTVTVPSGASTGPVTLTVAGSSATYSGFTVSAVMPPSASGLSRSLVNTGDPVTISGSGFNPDPTLDVLSINGTVTHVDTATATSISYTTPPTHSFGHVTVATPAGKSTTSADIVSVPSPFATADVAWVGRIKNDGTGSAISFPQTQKIALALFDVAAGQRAMVSFTDSTLASCYEIHVWGPNETVGDHSESVCSNSAYFDLPDATAPGTYEIEIQPASTDTGSVTVSATAAADPTTEVTIGGAGASLTTTIPGQHAVFTFPGTAGQRVFTAITTGANTTDFADARLVGPDGVVVASTSSELSYLSGGQGDIDTATLPVTGTYRVIVDPQNAGTGTWQTAVSTVPADLVQSGSIGGGSVSFPLTTMGQNGTLTFSGTAGTKIFTRVSVANATVPSGCVYLQLDNAATPDIADSCTTAATGYLDDVTLPTTAIYTLRVDPEGLQTANVTVTVLSVPSDAQVSAAADGTTRSAAITYGQGAGYTFTATAGQRVLITTGVSGVSSSNVRTTLLAPDGSTKALEYGGYLGTTTLATAGTYTVVVKPDGDAVGTSSATIYNVPADVTKAATPNGAAATATTTAVGQGAVFSFPVTAGQTLSISCSDNLTNNPGNGNPALSLLDPSGHTVDTNNYGCTSATSTVFTDVAAASGTYKVTATLPGISTGGVTLQVFASSYVTATATVDGAQVSVTTATAGQKAQIKFTTTAANQTVYVVGAPSFTSASGGYATAQLLDPSGNSLATDSVFSGDPPSTWFEPTTLATAGTYIIQINPPGDATGTFKAQVFGSFITAAATVGGAQVSVATTVPGQKARITFATSAANQTVYVIGTPSFTSASGGYTRAYLNDASGSTLQSTTMFVGDSPSTWFGPLTLATAGTYTIQIEPPGDGTGTFKAQVFGSFVTAAATVGGAQVSVATTVPGQKARITFTTTVANQTVYVIGAPSFSSASGGYTRAYLNDASGSTLESTTMFVGDSPSTWFGPLTLASAGTYTIQIEPPGDGTGTFKLQVFGSFVTAAATVGGAQVSVTTTQPGQKARITFTTSTANQTVYIVGAPNVTSASGGSSSVRLNDPSGSSVQTTYVYPGDAPSTWFAPLQLAAAGTYAVQIEPPGDGTGTFMAQVFGSFAAATATVNGAQVSATTTKAGQEARVSFTGAANQTVYVSGSSSTTDANGDYTWYYLLDPTGNQLSSGLTSTTSASNLFGAQSLAAAGTYIVQVAPPVTLTGTITIKVSTTPPPGSVPRATKPSGPVTASPPTLRHVPLGKLRALLASDTKPVTTAGLGAHPAQTSAHSTSRPWPAASGAPIWSQRPTPPPSDARLTGRILTTDGKPLAHVTVSIDGRHAVTDHDGRFTLNSMPEGTRVLRMDGRTASHGATTYGVFDVQVHLKHGANSLTYTPYLPVLDTVHEIAIPSPTTKEVVLTNPGIPGLEVHIPAGVTVLDADGKPVHRLGITPIPVARTPIPMPQGVQVPVYYTIQPAGGHLVGGDAWLVYPNYLHQQPGTPVNFWHYEKHGEGWETYGAGTVDAAGTQVHPNPGTHISDFDGAMINVGGWRQALWHGLAQSLGFSGDPVDLQTGLFRMEQTDLTVNDVMPLELTRAYGSGDTYQRPFGAGQNDLYDTFLSSQNQYQEADLNFVDGSTIHYVRTTPGNGYANAAFAASTTPTSFSGSTMVWNGAGWNLRLTDGTVMVYGENAPLQKIIDANGNTILILRANKNAYGNYIGDITDVRSPNGYWLHYTFDTSDRITQVQDSGGRTVQYTYDTASGPGNLKTVKDPDGGITTYGYDGNGRLSTITDARQNLYLTNTYDANGRIATQALAGGVGYTFSYTLDANNNVTATTVTDNTGHIRKVGFDANGNLVSDTRAASTSSQRAIAFTLDPTSQLPTSINDGLGRTITTVYDPLGQATSATYAAGTTAASIETATYKNTPYGLPDTVTDPANHTSTFSYDGAGDRLTAADSLSHTTVDTYTDQGQLQTDKTPLGHVTTYTYDNGGTGNLTSVTDPLGRTSRIFYDAVGRAIVETAPDGATTRTVYDPANLVTQLIDAEGNVTAFGYDADGNMTSATDARQFKLGSAAKSTTFVYDTADRLTKTTDPLGNSDTYTYDPTSARLSTWTDRRGKTTEYRYDDLGRISFTGYGRTGSAPNYSYESTLTYTYDGSGRLHTLADSTSGAGSITYGYDDLDRLTSESGPSGSVSYTYYADSRLKTLTPSGLAASTYAYDAAGRTQSITQGSRTVGYTFDNDDQLATETMPDGIVITPTYDNAGEVIGAIYTKGSTTLGNLTYTYDADGRINGVTGSLAAISLPAVVTGQVYDAANRLTAIGSVTFTYDNDGNLASDGTSTYTWNARGQLTGVTGPQNAALTYDPAGRLATCTVGSLTTTYRYGGVQQLAQQGSDGSVLTYLAGLGVDDVLASTDGAGNIKTLLPDILGSVIATADATGTITATYTYDPFGTATAPTGDTNPIRFTGLSSGPSLPNGLQYNRARFYDPSIQRFISQDPSGLSSGTVNLYTYANADPVDSLDPSGEISLSGIKHDVGGFISHHWRGILQTGAFIACLGGPLVCGIAEVINTGADYIGDGYQYGFTSQRALGNLENGLFWDAVSLGVGAGGGKIAQSWIEKDGYVANDGGSWLTQFFRPRSYIPQHAAGGGSHAMDWSPLATSIGGLGAATFNQATCSGADPGYCSWHPW